MAFDPDKYLAGSLPAAGGFDPDAYLASKSPKVGAGDTATKPAKLSAGDVLSHLWNEAKSSAKYAGEVTRDAAAGAVRGAGSIGSTLLMPYDAVMGNDNDQRRRDIDAGLQAMGADPESTSYGAGKLGAEIAGTAGAGGVLAKGVTALGRAIPAIAPYMPKVATALESGGFRTTPPAFMGPTAAPTLAAKAGDMALRTGAAATVGGTAAGAIDPENAGAGALIGGAIPGGVKVAGAVGGGAKDLVSWAMQHALGLSTGAGGNAVKTAYQAGKNGATAFADNMRGNVQMTDVLDDAKAALSKIRMNRSEAYQQGMGQVAEVTAPIDLSPILKATAKVQSAGSFKGEVINENAAGVVNQVAEKVNRWASLNPAEYHTPAGLDALKQSIGDILETTKPGTNAHRVVNDIYSSIKAQITAKAPIYAKTMKDYSEASELISEIQRSLVGGSKASADTAMRKLQSVMRNNVNTNYGNRLNLARELEQQGGREILPAIAGQAMSSAIPRGLQGAVASGAGLYGLTNPATLAALPFASPRLVGEAAYGAGRVAGKTGDTIASLFGPAALPAGQSSLPPSLSALSLLSVAPAVALSR